MIQIHASVIFKEKTRAACLWLRRSQLTCSPHSSQTVCFSKDESSPYPAILAVLLVFPKDKVGWGRIPFRLSKLPQSLAKSPWVGLQRSMGYKHTYAYLAAIWSFLLTATDVYGHPEAHPVRSPAWYCKNKHQLSNWGRELMFLNQKGVMTWSSCIIDEIF